MNQETASTLAERRADRLLRAHLNSIQQDELTEHRLFRETRGERTFTFHLLPPRPPVPGFVAVTSSTPALTYDEDDHCLTAGTAGLPVATQALALLLFLRADDHHFRSIANTDEVWPCQF